MVKLQAALTLGSALLGAAPTLAAPSNLHTRQNGGVRESLADVLSGPNRNCFLRGMAAIQARKGGSNSYETIAGIHGMTTRRGATPAGRQQSIGFCTHIDASFPCWHARYIDELENAAREAPGGCTTFRLSYWDWARDPLPAECNQPQIEIDGRMQHNPLYSYQFGPRTDDGVLPSGPGAQNLRETVRRPIRSGNSWVSQPESAANFAAQLIPQLNEKVFTMLTQSRTDWEHFSNKEIDNNRDDDPDYDSLETIHDNIHTAIGGDDGHMTYTGIAAFDPLFWVHHCNVDRLLAMWRAVHPDISVQAGNNDMRPWGGSPTTICSSDRSGFYTDAQGTASQVRTRINALYCSNGNCLNTNTNAKRDNKDCDTTVTHTVKTVSKSFKKTKTIKKKHSWKSYKWVDADDWKDLIRDKVFKKGSDTRSKYTCRIRTSSKASHESLKVIFFGGETCKDKNWNEKQFYERDDFIGMYSPFGTYQNTTMDGMKDVTVGGTVHLDAATYNWIGAGKLESTDEKDVVPYLKEHLCYKIIDRTGKEYEAKDIAGLGIDVVVTPLTQSKKKDAFPQYGKSKKCLTIY